MYKFDLYHEKVYATEKIKKGDTIGIPYQKMNQEYFLTANNRLGEFLNESENGNAKLVPTPGIGAMTMYILESTTDIFEGEEIRVIKTSFPIDRIKEDEKENYSSNMFALKEEKKLRIKNVSEILEVYENLDQIDCNEDKIKVIESLKEASKIYNGLNIDLEVMNENYNINLYTEAANDDKKRKRIESLILNTMSKLDKSGINTEFYKNTFNNMNTDQFYKWIDKLVSDEDENFYLEIQPHKNEPNLKDLKEALKFMKVPVNEYVYFRHEENEDDPLRTRYKVCVGYIFVKRLQQILSKKNTYSTDIKSRNMLTGSVTGDDKIARISDSETYVMTATGLDSALEEFLGPRADNNIKKAQMYQQIATYGYCSLKDMKDDLKTHTTLNTMDTYLLGAGIESDLLVEENHE